MPFRGQPGNQRPSPSAELKHPAADVLRANGREHRVVDGVAARTRLARAAMTRRSSNAGDVPEPGIAFVSAPVESG